jgi:hypothetical protein
VALWAALAWPLVSGERTLVLRDVMTTHLPYKWFGAEELQRGSIPALNPTWALGQPFRGNPNALPLYPGNLFYLALPFWSAFMLHYMLHWLLAFFGMRGLARALGQSEAATLLSGLAYAGSGLFFSLLTFYNLLTVGAWAPWVLWGLVRGGRRGIALGGLACGLMLLGGEPVAAALVVPAMLVAAWERRTLPQAVANAAAVGVLGLVVALPQLVATARVISFSFRTAHGLGPDQVVSQSLHPLRMLELLIPLPWGWPSSIGRFGFWSEVVTPQVPYIYSIHVGLIAAALACCVLRSRWRWAGLSAGALLLAWAGGLSGEVVLAMTGGLFRYPQKLALLFTLAVAPLAGWGLDRVMAVPRASRGLLAGGIVLLSAGVAALLFRGALAELLREALAKNGEIRFGATAAANWAFALLVAGGVLGAAAWAVRRRSAVGVVAVQLVALLQFAPALPTDEVANLTGLPSFGELVRDPATLLCVPQLLPDWERRTPHRLEGDAIQATNRAGRLNLEPAYGVPHGLRYPLAPDLEGMTSPLSVFLLENLAVVDWSVRAAWLRRLGVGWVVRYGDEAVVGLERVRTDVHVGAPIGLDRVNGPLPFARWPERVVAARNPIEAFLFLSRSAAGTPSRVDGIAVSSRPVEHRPGATVALVEEGPDRIAIDVAGEGGLLVVTRAWQPILRARLGDGTALGTQPVDVTLLGVEVPAGEHRVTIDVSSWPETTAGIAAAVVALALLAVARLDRGRSA